MSNIKQLARLRGSATAITGDRRQGPPPEVPATRRVHVAIDDATRPGLTSGAADEQKATTVWLPGPCRADGFSGTGDAPCRRILSDNGPSYRLE